MKFYQKYFALLPFKYDTGMVVDEDEIQKYSELTRKFPFMPSFVIAESEIDPSIKNVIDFKFLYGFVEPTLAILFEPVQTFAG